MNSFAELKCKRVIEAVDLAMGNLLAQREACNARTVKNDLAKINKGLAFWWWRNLLTLQELRERMTQSRVDLRGHKWPLEYYELEVKSLLGLKKLAEASLNVSGIILVTTDDYDLFSFYYRQLAGCSNA